MKKLFNTWQHEIRLVKRVAIPRKKINIYMHKKNSRHFFYTYIWNRLFFPFSPKGSMQGATILLGNSKQMSYCNFSPYSHAALQLH